ncbi:MAG: polysaccharide biosynthesis protein, partial [Eggerthellaceae bacterium]|nr:polysaccharide biosynthesis protein [Eggerthellaceae bacterium]
IGGAIAWIAFGERLPWRVYVLAWALLLLVCGSARFAIRLYSGRKGWSVMGITQSNAAPRSIVVGAGEVGALTVSRMLAGNPDVPGIPVGLVDDDPAKAGGHIHGVKVLGAISDLPKLAKQFAVEQLVLAIPSATRAERERILRICAEAGLKTLTVPELKDFPRGKGEAIPLREVEISDLLARDEVELDLGQMGYIAGKSVLVTGGGGSIGSEIVRQLLPAKPSKIVVFDVYENTAYELFHELKGKAASQGTELVVEIGSITHMPALEKAFDDHAPQVVFHAAAHKHVPLMERNAREAVENNVFGTLNVVRLAHERNCTHFVLISTDKAVNPANVMGATKRACEMIVQRYAAESETVFAAVRFGNVLGSHGSVIPLFRRQLKEGGPITVTHRDITRYFMTIPEASRLVITAGALAKGGEIFVLDMGEPVRIWDLAENLVRLSGLRPGIDIQIVETGLRPGEKMYEELLMSDEEQLPTSNPSITVSAGEPPTRDRVEAGLELLHNSLEGDNDSIKQALAQAVTTYHPQ